MQNPSDTPWRGLGSPAVDVNPTTLAPARTGKTRRGRRGGRGRSLSPRPCGVLGPGVVSPAPAVGWFATPEVVGHHPPQHRVGAAPLTSSTREDMPESGTVAWGHQVRALGYRRSPLHRAPRAAWASCASCSVPDLLAGFFMCRLEYCTDCCGDLFRKARST